MVGPSGAPWWFWLIMVLGFIYMMRTFWKDGK